MAQITQFGKAVKKQLIERGMTQKQLAERISKATGLYVDGQYISKILNGQRMPEKLLAAISKELNIEIGVDSG